MCRRPTRKSSALYNFAPTFMEVCITWGGTSPPLWHQISYWQGLLFSVDLLPINQLIQLVNTLRPRQNGRHFAEEILKFMFFNENVWIPFKISLKFLPKGPINNIPALVQIMAWRRSGDKPLSEPMMVRLTTHLCVARPQWVTQAWMSTFCAQGKCSHIHFLHTIMHFSEGILQCLSNPCSGRIIHLGWKKMGTMWQTGFNIFWNENGWILRVI